MAEIDKLNQKIRSQLHHVFYSVTTQKRTGTFHGRVRGVSGRYQDDVIKDVNWHLANIGVRLKVKWTYRVDASGPPYHLGFAFKLFTMKQTEVQHVH